MQLVCWPALLPLRGLATCAQTTKNKKTVPALSATAEEFSDNLECAVQLLRSELCPACEQLLLSVDNASIHRLPAGRWDPTDKGALLLRVPPHSPDLHQVIEHLFGQLKPWLVQQLYACNWAQWRAWTLTQRAAKVRALVLQWCREHVTPQAISSQFEQLKQCYEVVAAPTTQQVMVGSHFVDGTGGGYPSKALR
jgi:transposase